MTATMLYGFGVLITFLLVVVLVWTIGLKKRTFWRAGYTYSVVIAYIIAGFIAMLFVKQQPVMPEVTAQELAEVQQAEQTMRDALYNAHFSALDEQYIEEQWTFPVKEDETITIHYNNAYGDRVYVNYSEELVGEMTLSYFKIPTIYDRIDISENDELPTISFEQNELIVQLANEHRTMYYYQAQSTLMTLEPLSDSFRAYSTGTHVLYLNVPQNVHIINESDL